MDLDRRALCAATVFWSGTAFSVVYGIVAWDLNTAIVIWVVTLAIVVALCWAPVADYEMRDEDDLL